MIHVNTYLVRPMVEGHGEVESMLPLIYTVLANNQ